MMTRNEKTSPGYRRAFDQTPSTQHVAMVFVMTQEWQKRLPRRITLSLTLSTPSTIGIRRLNVTPNGGAGRKLVELTKLHTCLKEKGRMKSRPSTDTTSRWSRKREKPVHR